MRRCTAISLILALLVTGVFGCARAQTEQVGTAVRGIGIARHPPADHKALKPLVALLAPRSVGDVDLRHADLRRVDLSACSDQLLARATFDTATQWPDGMPEGFRPETALEEGKNPGLGIRELHNRGITGRGVSIAIIDQTLLVDHVEYRDRLRHYEEINASQVAEMHGPAVASIAVGKSVGVAPEADLYYFATPSESRQKRASIAHAISRVLEINELLPPEMKIRVISLSHGWLPGQPEYEVVDAAVRKARDNGIFVVSTSVGRYYSAGLWRRFYLLGLGGTPGSDPDDPASYRPGYSWKEEFPELPGDSLLIPMDSRATAGPTDTEDYTFYRIGGMSWSIPWVAGLYALALQVNPKTTPKSFARAALETSTYIPLHWEDRDIQFGPIVNPIGLIEKLGKT